MNRSAGALRTVALVAALVGAAGSLGFMLNAGRRTPRFLLVIFVFWVLSPFVVLVWAHMTAKRWSAVTRSALHIVMLVVALGSLVIYANDTLRPRRAQAAFVYVLVPPVSWLLIAIVVPTAALIARRRSHGG